MLFSTRRHERTLARLFKVPQLAFTMRIHCKIVVIAVCFGVFLLLYFFGGNAADDPLLKEVDEDYNSSPSSSPEQGGGGHNVAFKFTPKSHDKPQLRMGEPRQERKEATFLNRRDYVNAKR